MPDRIQLRRAKGWRMPPDTVKVDRTTPWGNPFVVGQHGDRARCVQLHRYLLSGYAVVTSSPTVQEQLAYLQHTLDHIDRLRGKHLACWCPASAPCHADALLELANRVAP